MRASVRDVLRASGTALVGRDEELRWMRQVLTGPDRPTLVAVHGPGGVGKSAFLAEVVRISSDCDLPVLSVDASDLAPDRRAVLAALGVAEAAADTPDGTDLSPLGAYLAPGTVIVIDHLEALGPLERWVYTSLVPTLPSDVRLVTACRRPPPEESDELRRAGLLVPLPLRNLTAEQSEELLRRCGIPAEVDVDAVVRATHGHPLALVIAADTWVGTAGSDTVEPPSGELLRHPDPAGRLLRRFVDDIDEPGQRAALHVAAHARRVDRRMLREALDLDDPTADDLLDWLRARPYAEAHPDGLGLHQVARDAIDADLRWRDQAAYAELHERVRRVIVARLRTGEPFARQRAGMDLLFLHRHNPLAGALWDYDRLGTMTMRPATAADLPAAHRIVETVEGPVRAEWVHRWSVAQPRSLHVMEAEGEVVGIASLARLSASADLRSSDPVSASSWNAINERRPPAAGELVMMCLGADGTDPERLGGVSDLMAVRCLVEWTAPDLGWVVVASSRAHVWAPVWQYVGFEPMTSVTTADGRVTEIWGRDFGRSPLDEWLAALAAREIDEAGQVPDPVAAPVAFSREDFDRYARDALRAYHQDEVLAGSPLLAAALVRRGLDGAAQGVLIERLRDVFLDAVADLEDDPALVKAARALDRTYLRRASTQEAAAEVLGMPFSTYRRHLARGHEALVDLLWQREIGAGRRVSSD